MANSEFDHKYADLNLPASEMMTPEELAVALNLDETEEKPDTEEQIKHKRKFRPKATTGPESWAASKDDYWLQKKPHWTETRMGKVGVEILSRLTLGGIAYSWMSNSKALATIDRYNPGQYKLESGKTDWNALQQGGVMQWIAYAIDRTLGLGIKNIHHGIFKDEEKAQKFVTFRENRLSNPSQIGGRSLGAEMVKVTADFAAMSAGTAVARNTILGFLNPKERAAWTKDGKFDLAHIAKRFSKKIFEIVTYNAGEDMAVALPYVFYLRGSRNFIDKYITPGFKWDSDEVDNGGSFVLNKQGSVMNQMQLAGALDIQGRFTIYNVFTQYYRDFYNATGERLRNWKKSGFQLKTPDVLKKPEEIPSKIANNFTGGLRYLFISMVTSILQMTPSVPFFALFRVPMSKIKGRAINPKYGVMQMEDGTALTAAQLRNENGELHDAYKWETRKAGQMKFYWSQPDENGNRIPVQYTPAGSNQTINSPNPFSERGPEKGSFEPFGFSKPGRRLQHDTLARVTDKIGKAATDVARHKGWERMSGWFWDIVEPNATAERRSKLARDAGTAAIPYASYFAAKVYFKEYVNDQMRLAVGRALDGLLKLDGKEIREGLSEIGKTVQGLPLSNPDRQALLIESHRYNPSDRSPIPSDWTPELHKKYKDFHAEHPDREIGAYDLAHILAERRSRHYLKRSDEIQELTEKQITRAELDEFIKARTEEGPATPDTLKDQYSTKTARDIARERKTKPTLKNTKRAANWTERNEEKEILSEPAAIA